MRRYEYLKLYEVEYYEAPNGKMKKRSVYKGPHYTFDDADRKAVVRDGLVLALISLAAFVAAGCLRSCWGQHVAWVAIPYVLNLIAPLYTMGGLLRLRKMKCPATEVDRGDGQQALGMGSIYQLIFGAAWTVTSLVSLIVYRAYIIAWPSDIVFALMGVVTLVCGIFQFRSARRLVLTLTEEAPANA